MNAWSQCIACIAEPVWAWVWRKCDSSCGRHWFCRRGDARRFVLVAGLILQGCLGGLGQTATAYHQHADQALQSFLLKFWSASSQYLHNSYPSDGTLAGRVNAWFDQRTRYQLVQ